MLGCHNLLGKNLFCDAEMICLLNRYKKEMCLYISLYFYYYYYYFETTVTFVFVTISKLFVTIYHLTLLFSG